VEPAFLKSLNYNEEYRQKYFPNAAIPSINDYDLDGDAEYEQNKSFLSKALYYEFLNDKK
jgi:hypothetical protein